MRSIALLAIIMIFTNTAVYANVKVNFAGEWSTKGEFLKKGGKIFGTFSYWNPRDKEHKPLQDVKISFENGEMKIDTSACKPDKDGKYGFFILVLNPTEKLSDPSSYSDKYMLTSAEVKSDKSVKIELSPFYKTGNTIFYVRNGYRVAETDWKELSYEFNMQEGVSSEPSFRLVFEEPCVLQIKNVSLKPVESKDKEVTKGNQILNGGAERGYYAVSASHFDEMYNKSFLNWINELHTKAMVVSLDDKEAASGKYSFRLEGKDQKNREFTSYFCFNPVKYTLGKRSVITFKAKGKEKGGSLALKLALSPSKGYIKRFELTEEWKEYTYEIPVFGENAGYYSKAENQQCYPMFWTNQDVWLDEVCYWQGSEKIQYSIPTPVAVSGELAKTYINLGEDISAVMNLRNTTDKKQKVYLSCDVTDMSGGILMSKKKVSKIIEPGDSVEEKIILTPEKRGVQTLNVVVESSENKTNNGFLFGVIGPERGLVKRIAMDCEPNASGDFLVPFYRDMRIGTARSWYSRSGERSVNIQKSLHDAGIRTLLNISFGLPYSENSFVPKDLSGWSSFLKAEILPHKDYIDVYEILNEPNIWNGYRKNPDSDRLKEMSPEAYVETIKIASDIIKKVDANAKIAGPTTCKFDIPFIKRTLKAGGDKYIDIITGHPYCPSPEMSGLYKEILWLRDILKNYGDKPYWATEAGFKAEGMLNNNIITNSTRDCIYKTIRNMLTTYAAGADVYTVFSLRSWNFCSEYNLSIFGTTGRVYDIAPQPVLYAVRAVADIVGDAKACGHIYLGYDFKCYLFDNGKERIVTLWRWNGKPGKIKTNISGVFYDIMGNVITDKEIVINQAPVYFKTKLSINDTKKLFSALTPDGKNIRYLTNISITSKNTFDVLIKNAGMINLSGTAEISSGENKQKVEIKDIKPGDEFKAGFSTNKAINLIAQKEILDIDLNGQKYHAPLELQAMFSPHAKQNMIIDGKLDEWNNISGVTLNYKDNGCVSGNQSWGDTDKLITAEIKTCWDEDNFYIAVIVNKNGFYPVNRTANSMWRGDSLQLAFDPLKNALKDNLKYDDDDFEYSLGMFNNKPTVYRALASSGKYDSLSKTTGVLDHGEVKLAIEPSEEKVIYEAAFAKRSVSPFKLISGSSTRFSIIVNINNGEDRLGWLELTSGIGQSPKNPSLFMDLILQP